LSAVPKASTSTPARLEAHVDDRVEAGLGGLFLHPQHGLAAPAVEQRLVGAHAPADEVAELGEEALEVVHGHDGAAGDEAGPLDLPVGGRAPQVRGGHAPHPQLAHADALVVALFRQRAGEVADGEQHEGDAEVEQLGVHAQSIRTAVP
jgi:hypothetical protein